MDDLIECSQTLSARCEAVLGRAGVLEKKMSGFVVRPEQVTLAATIAQTIDEKQILVAEAGTGTGKTYAYLVPALLSGGKTLISTATKTLQDQLFQKDLPMLVNALQLSVRIQILKGRSNYLCRYRTERYAEEGQFIEFKTAAAVAHIRERLPRLIHGERSELPDIPEESSAWSFVTSTSENCLGTDCPHLSSCFLMQARRRALDADVVVINHHLYFADAQLKEEGLGELLPGVQTVVFDEAHQVADIATQFHDQRLSTRQLKELLDDIIREWPVLDLPNQPLKTWRVHLDMLLDQLDMALPVDHDRLAWRVASSQPAVQEAWQSLIHFLSDLVDVFATISLDEQLGLARCFTRLQALIAFVTQFQSERAGVVQWVERFKQSVMFHATPIDVAESVQSLLSRVPCAYIFTSATLAIGASFDNFSRQLGLSLPKTLLLKSPFDYQKQTLLYLPRGLPDPRQSLYHVILSEKVKPLIEALGGRSFFLFTSHRALQETAVLLRQTLSCPILIQGEESKSILLARFRALGNAVLLGTSTFWEGVDVKGEALSCVMIDKIPFLNPTDPVICGRISDFKTRGLSGFDELSLPHAILALKQGVGRLIRDAADRGVLVLADPRLTAREYGRHIFQSLPSMRKTREEQTVLTFIQDLMSSDEPISN